MYTHEIKKSGQRCYHAPWMPLRDRNYIQQDREWPLMVLESGQITKVNWNNLRRLD